jgi:hypothetical protein
MSFVKHGKILAGREQQERRKEKKTKGLLCMQRTVTLTAGSIPTGTAKDLVEDVTIENSRFHPSRTITIPFSNSFNQNDIHLYPHYSRG